MAKDPKTEPGAAARLLDLWERNIALQAASGSFPAPKPAK